MKVFYGISKTGYILDKLYIDTNFNVEFDYNQKLYENITIYAKWRKATPYEMLDEYGKTLLDSTIRIIDLEQIDYNQIYRISVGAFSNKDLEKEDYSGFTRMYYIFNFVI